MSTPAFGISLGGTDITGHFTDRLLALDLMLHDGHQNDRLSLTLDDRDFAIAQPPTDSELSLMLGYRETGLVFMGTYSVDEVAVTGPPYKMGISATAAKQKSAQKQHRTRKYEKKTIGAIMGEIAERYGLSPVVSGELASFQYPYLHQLEESDWHLGTRLSFDHDALFSIKNNRLFFVKRGDSTSAGGAAMPQLTLKLTDLIRYQAALGDRANHKGANAGWYDRKKGKSVKERSDVQGGGKGEFMVRHLRPTQEEAKASANSKAGHLNRAVKTCEVEIEGDPTAQAEGTMLIQTGRSLLDDNWLIQTVRHHLSPEGYRCTIAGQIKPSAAAARNS
jgi:phage protein D